MRRRLASLSFSAVLLLTGVAAAPAASARQSRVGELQVVGAVSAPASYSRAELAALPQTTLPDRRSPWGGTVTGVSLADLVAASEPVLPDGKNPQLLVRVTLTGLIGARTVALGELDPDFGNHPALLALALNGRALPAGPYLAVPADSGYARTVIRVTRIDVAVATPTTPTGVPAGSVLVADRGRTRLLAAGTLSALPRSTRTVTFSASGAPQTHTETGPTLAAVLHAAGVPSTPTTAVTAVGSDGYGATVTPAEATSGRRPLLLSLNEDGAPLAQPRLIAAGDVRGGRDVSNVLELDVSR